MTATVPVRVATLPHGRGLPLPALHSAAAAGADLRAALPEGEPVELAPGGRAVVPCGFAMALPEGFEGQVRPRSGLAARHGVTVLNSPGTIDAGYRGEIKVPLLNTDPREAFPIEPGDRIAQLIVMPVSRAVFEPVDELPESERGGQGFGSTGVRDRTR